MENNKYFDDWELEDEELFQEDPMEELMYYLNSMPETNEVRFAKVAAQKVKKEMNNDKFLLAQYIDIAETRKKMLDGDLQTITQEEINAKVQQMKEEEK